MTEANDSDNNGTVDQTTAYTYTGTTQTGKTVTNTTTTQVTSQTTYNYDLQGRMQQVTIDSFDALGTLTRREVSTFDYDTKGIRVSALHEVDSNGDGTFETRTLSEYLVDARNHTGPQQVLEETVTNADTGALIKKVVYTIGSDVIAQTTFTPGGPAEGETLVFLYDGHGSTRFLADLAAAIVQTFNYDAYGNAIGFDAAAAKTTLLYSGEQFDSRIGQQYLRARYYNSATGRFNRLDPFAGNAQDPQSLHKYLYTYGDPVNGIDPSGLVTLGGLGISMGASNNLRSQNQSATTASGATALQRVQLLAGPRSPYQVLIRFQQLLGRFRNFTRANARFNLRLLTGRTPRNHHAHHIFPQRFADFFRQHRINIHNPRFLQWWQQNSHIHNSPQYNRLWLRWITNNQNATTAQVLQKGRELMQLFNQTTLF